MSTTMSTTEQLWVQVSCVEPIQKAWARSIHINASVKRQNLAEPGSIKMTQHCLKII